MQLLGFDSSTGTNQGKVRKSWPTGTNGSPGWKRNEDVCFIRAEDADDSISKQFDTNYSNNDSVSVNQQIDYSGVFQISLIFYGPNSNMHAKMVKNALYSSNDIKLLLQQNNLYVVQDVNIPQRVPELFVGQWWGKNRL